jgi:hypothetical protein
VVTKVVEQDLVGPKIAHHPPWSADEAQVSTKYCCKIAIALIDPIDRDLESYDLSRQRSLDGWFYGFRFTRAVQRVGLPINARSSCTHASSRMSQNPTTSKGTAQHRKCTPPVECGHKRNAKATEKRTPAVIRHFAAIAGRVPRNNLAP